MWQRWNQTTHIFEKSIDDGAIWVPLPLDGTIISEGTVADARLSSNVALKNAANVFTADQKLSKTRPQIQLVHSGTALTRLAQWIGNNSYFSANLSFDGTNWNLDDTSLAGISFTVGPTGLNCTYATAGANPRTPVSIGSIDAAGLLTVLGQIAFPATQNPSSNANVFDDYEEGTWTPTITSSGGGAATYNSQNGYYTKKGSEVHASGYLNLASKGTLGGGNLSISGLPFTIANITNNFIAVNMPYWAGMTTPMVHMGGFGSPNGTSFFIIHASGAQASIVITTLGDLGAGAELIFHTTYRSAS